VRKPLLAAGIAGALVAGLALIAPAVSAAAASDPLTPRPVAYVYGGSSASWFDLPTMTNTPIADVTTPHAIATSSKGNYVFIATDDGVQELGTSIGRAYPTLKLGYVSGLAVSHDGNWLYSAMWTQDTVFMSPVGINAGRRITGIAHPLALALTPDAKYLYVTNTDGTTPLGGSDTVTVVDTASQTVVGTIPVPASPFAIAASPDGTAMYVLSDGDLLTAIDTASRAVRYTVPVGNTSIDVVPSLDGSKLYVSDADGVQVVDPATGKVTRTVPTPGDGFGMALSPDGADLYVARPNDKRISRISTADDTLRPADLDIVTDTPPYDLVVAAAPYLTSPVASPDAQPGPAGSLDVTVSGEYSIREYAPIVAYHYDFGDGASADSTTGTEKITHHYARPGEYAVTLTVTDNIGLTGQYTVAVMIEPAPTPSPSTSPTPTSPTPTRPNPILSSPRPPVKPPLKPTPTSPTPTNPT
jgi:YVTN family beta-propeller protein